jgi:hypothetical protein
LKLQGFVKRIAPTSVSQALQNTLEIIDNRTGKSYMIPLVHNAIWAPLLKQIKAPETEENADDEPHKGVRVYDPGLRNTAVSKSAITYMLVFSFISPKAQEHCKLIGIVMVTRAYYSIAACPLRI